MSMRHLYYNVIEELYCFMAKNDSRIKKEKGWKLWSIDDEPTVDDDGFEAEILPTMRKCSGRI
jgi:hypothetical protein